MARGLRTGREWDPANWAVRRVVASTNLVTLVRFLTNLARDNDDNLGSPLDVKTRKWA